MSDSPITVTPHTPCGEAVDLLYEFDVRHIPVVDGGIAVGVVSDRDLRNLINPRDVEIVSIDGVIELRNRPVSVVMATQLITIDPDSESAKAAALMVDHRVSSVLVVEGSKKRLIGIVSYVDVLEEFVQLKNNEP